MNIVKQIVLFFCLFQFTTPFSVASASVSKSSLTWHGHAAFEIHTPKGKVLFIDPWLKNPANSQVSAVTNVKKADYILISHGHSDHVGDAVEIAKATKAKLVTNFELGNALVTSLSYPKDQAGMDTLFNIGGELNLADGEVMVAMTPAVHSSGLDVGDGKMVYGGSAAGFVIQIKNGPTIYHSGDTAYFQDMGTIKERYKPDVALLNIGGHFGMEPEMASKAAQAIHASIVVPHHFKTFPILTQDATPFTKSIQAKGMRAVVMSPGQTITFLGNKLEK